MPSRLMANKRLQPSGPEKEARLKGSTSREIRLQNRLTRMEARPFSQRYGFVAKLTLGIP